MNGVEVPGAAPVLTRSSPIIQSPSSQPAASVQAAPAAQPAPIEDTWLAPLYAESGELSGYGLYSYALLVKADERAKIFLGELVKTPRAGDLKSSGKDQINLLNIPSKPAEAGRCNPFESASATGCVSSARARPIEAYNFPMAHEILIHLCAVGSPRLADFCSHGFDGGPYLLTYASPVSGLHKISPPLLFVDLTGKPESVFEEYLAAYKDQVKSPDPTDGAKINTLRLNVLTWIARAANAAGPVDEATAGILNIVSAKPNQ